MDEQMGMANPIFRFMNGNQNNNNNNNQPPQNPDSMGPDFLNNNMNNNQMNPMNFNNNMNNNIKNNMSPSKKERIYNIKKNSNSIII